MCFLIVTEGNQSTPSRKSTLSKLLTRDRLNAPLPETPNSLFRETFTPEFTPTSQNFKPAVETNVTSSGKISNEPFSSSFPEVPEVAPTLDDDEEFSSVFHGTQEEVISSRSSSSKISEAIRGESTRAESAVVASRFTEEFSALIDDDPQPKASSQGATKASTTTPKIETKDQSAKKDSGKANSGHTTPLSDVLSKLKSKVGSIGSSTRKLSKATSEASSVIGGVKNDIEFAEELSRGYTNNSVKDELVPLASELAAATGGAQSQAITLFDSRQTTDYHASTDNKEKHEAVVQGWSFADLDNDVQESHDRHEVAQGHSGTSTSEKGKEVIHEGIPGSEADQDNNTESSNSLDVTKKNAGNLAESTSLVKAKQTCTSGETISSIPVTSFPVNSQLTVIYFPRFR
jgi:hypothetical protein